MGHEWDFGSVLVHWPLLRRGLQGTLLLAAVCILAAAIIGLVVGAGRYSERAVARWPATAFVELFRNTPVLVSLIWFFFAFPILTGIRLDLFSAAAIAIALNAGAFAAEIFRGGMQSIARGQWDACRAIGMTHTQMLRRVILPQAVKRMLPAFTNRAIEILKTTSIASVIAYFELLHSARTISSSYFNPIEAFTVVAVMYFLIVYPLSILARVVEKTLRRSD
jgi:polar amino acid transport system permease protein